MKNFQTRFLPIEHIIFPKSVLELFFFFTSPVFFDHCYLHFRLNAWCAPHFGVNQFENDSTLRLFSNYFSFDRVTLIFQIDFRVKMPKCVRDRDKLRPKSRIENFLNERLLKKQKNELFTVCVVCFRFVWFLFLLFGSALINLV